MSNLQTRIHGITAIRGAQLRRNELVVEGGAPYIHERLWRAPNESDVSWFGDAKLGVVGRVERAALVNDAGRVAAKINQYVFAEEFARAGADEAFLLDCTGEGEGVHDFMQRVSTAITYGRWCWVQVDRAPLRRDPVTGEAVPETLADRAPVRWRLWGANDVPDWSLDEDGGIRWLVVRSRVYVNSDPRADAVAATLSTLYERREDGVYVTEEADRTLPGVELRTDFRLEGMKTVPFVLVGRPTEKAWWFDDVERLQAQIMNLDSLHNETLTENVYPQLVLPLSLVNSLEAKLAERNVNGETIVAMVRELTIGRKTPIVENGEDKGVTRYIMPSGDIKLLTDEGTRKRSLLFDVVGLALFNRETRQAQTAESKAFDQLDTNATLGARAALLRRAEQRIVELSRAFDPSFGAWDPVYPTDFDVVDAAAVSAALAQSANMPDQTPMVRKILAKANLRVLREVAGGVATPDEFAEAMKEIEEADFEARETLPNPFGEEGGGTDDDDEPLTQEDAERIFEEIMAKRRREDGE